MTRPKTKPEDQYGYMTKHAKHTSGTMEFTTTKKNKVQLNINGQHSFLSEEEVFQMVKALLRTGAVQFGEEWLHRARAYAQLIHVIKEET